MTNEPKDNPDKGGYEEGYLNYNTTSINSPCAKCGKFYHYVGDIPIGGWVKGTEPYCTCARDEAEKETREKWVAEGRQQALKEVEELVNDFPSWDPNAYGSRLVERKKLEQAIDQLRNKGV